MIGPHAVCIAGCQVAERLTLDEAVAEAERLAAAYPCAVTVYVYEPDDGFPAAVIRK